MNLTRHCMLAAACLTLLAMPTVVRAETLLRAPQDAPQYRLGKVRLEDDNFGRTVLVISYTRTREGKGVVRLAGRSKDGPLQITFMPAVNNASGDLRLSKSFGGREGRYDYEFYLVVPAKWADKSYGSCLVSNRVQMGNPGPSPSARRWNAEEQAAYEKHQLKDAPPAELPDGYEAVSRDTPLAAGMRVKAGYFGDWIESELLAYSENGRATVRFLESDKIETVRIDGWLAARPSVLRRTASEPEAFSPSLRILPGGKTPLPKDAGPIPDTANLPRGAPLLKAKFNRKWETVYVVEDFGGTVETISDHHRDFFGRLQGKLRHTDSDKREALAIKRGVLADLDDPKTVKGWAVNLIPKKERLLDGDDLGDGGFNGGISLNDYHVIDRNYPIDTKIPRRAKKLPRDIEIPPGSTVAYCNIHDDWEAATLLADEEDTVVVRDLDGIGSFAYRLPRYQVIIQDKTLRKIEGTRSSKAADLKKTLRTWTDNTGQHKVEARFVSVEDDKVILKTDAGREIKLPLERLSDEDRELLEGLKAATDNPFE